MLPIAQETSSVCIFQPRSRHEAARGCENRSPATRCAGDGAQLGGRLGKTAVAVGNCYGFVGNRLLAVREREATFLLEEGASPEDVDRVLRGFGFPIGPFELRDLAGVDIAWFNRKGRGTPRPG